MKRYQAIAASAAMLLFISLRTTAQTAAQTTAPITAQTADQTAAQTAAPITAQTAAQTASDPAKDLTTYHEQHPEEKLYVHTDKDFYLSGEICWFKLYVVDATTLRPLDLSKVAYLEFLDKDNKPILQAKAGLADGHGDGSVYLPLTLRSGNYKLRAYTNWMKNYGMDWFFEKTITIVNARRSAELHSPDTTQTQTYPVSFFPEGGNLVENIPTKVGFRITDQYGRGIQCTGVVTEDDQDTVARFEPHRFGIGTFQLTPRPGHHYRAIFRLADGTAIPALLPAAAKEGAVMNITSEDQDHWRVTVQASQALTTSGIQPSQSAGSGQPSQSAPPTAAGIQPPPTAEVYLLGHTREQVKLARTAMLTDGKASFLIDKNTLGEGVSTLTLFDAARQPLCERLVFRRPAHPLHITIQPDKESYTTREKISLSIGAAPDPTAVNPTAGASSTAEASSTAGASATTGTSAAATASAPAGTSAPNCSLSVFRLDALQTTPQTHIADYLWLASDLKGKIDSPDYYFDHPEDEQAMDNLMLTYGWRRFHWGDVRSHAAPLFEFPPEYVGAIISGKLTDNHTNTPGRGVQVYLSVPGPRTQFTSAYSDDEGRVRFELKDFYGGQDIIVQTDPNRDSIYRFEVQSPWADTYTDDRPIPPYSLPQADSTSLSDKDIALQVLNRYGGERLKKFHLPPIADTTKFYYKADFSYLLDDYTRFTTMEEVMREYVTLMLVQRRGGHYHLPLFELPYNQFFDADPLILLDGVPVFNIDSLMALDPLKIRKLETMQRKIFMGGTYFPGMMSWTTYKGDLGGYILDPHSTVIDYEGLSMRREFYNPSYATPETSATHLPDFRNVLYWTPDVPMDPQGRGALSFYSSDIPGKYIVVVEGLTPDGSAGSTTTTFEVK